MESVLHQTGNISDLKLLHQIDPMRLDRCHADVEFARNRWRTPQGHSIAGVYCQPRYAYMRSERKGMKSIIGVSDRMFTTLAVLMSPAVARSSGALPLRKTYVVD